MNQVGLRRAARVVGFLMLLTACNAPPAVARPGSAFTTRYRGVSVIAPNRFGVVDYFDAEVFKAEQDAVLREARPIELPPQVELLAARVSFLSGVKHVYVNGTAGNFCTDTWPPAGYGPSYAVPDLEIAKGEILSVIFYVRAKEPGDWVVRGVQLTYQVGSQLFYQEGRAMTFTTQRRLDVNDLPTRPTCNPRIHLPWVEPSDKPSRLFVVRTPSPQAS
jgi:hypothetical protein